MFKKTLFSLTTMLCLKNCVYATTTGTYVPSEPIELEKVILILISIGLVALILFVGYKIDEKEAQEKVKEENTEESNVNVNNTDPKKETENDFLNKHNISKEISNKEKNDLSSLKNIEEKEEYNVIEKNDICNEYKNSYDSTMVFNTIPIKESKIVKDKENHNDNKK